MLRIALLPAQKMVLWGMVALALAFAVVLTGCKTDDDGGDKISVSATSGSVTITGLAAQNGKYLVAVAVESEPNLLAAASVSSSGSITGATITGGQATLKVWKVSSDGNSLLNYSGSDTATLYLMVLNKATVTGENLQSEAIGYGMATVNFSNGTGSAAGTLY